MSRRGKALSVALVVVTLLAGTARAITNTILKLGTIASYDFGAYGPGYPIPGTIQIQGFRMDPGDTVSWHYHKGLSYVILSRGTLTEEHVVGPNQCASEELTAGSAFVEGPNQVHSVTNTGKGIAVVWWATIYPATDTSGGIYPAEDPNCH